MELVHGGNVGGQNGDDVASLNAQRDNGGSEAEVAKMSFRLGESDVVVGDGGGVAIYVGGHLQEEPPRKQLPENQEKRSYIKWLDWFHQQWKQVLYVEFGSQAEILPEQLEELD
nr:UDP-glycosyltransferase 90A1 [Ipomoea batatas]